MMLHCDIDQKGHVVDMRSVIENYHLFADTSSLKHRKAQQFFYELVPFLLASKGQIIVPYKVVLKIERLQRSSKPHTKKAAKTAYGILRHYIEYGFVDIRGEKNDPSADNVFRHVFPKLISRYDLALLTQNKKLAMDILSLRDARPAQASKRLIVLKIDKDGDVLEWRRERPLHKSRGKQPSSNGTFRRFTHPRPRKDRVLRARMLPSTGDYVYAGDHGRVRLRNVIGEGGEGRVFATDTGHACKIFSRDRLTENRLAKLSLMSGRNIRVPGVCWPLAIAKNHNDEFVGYLMEKAEGKAMQRCVFVPDLLKKNFPRWTRMNLIRLSITWLEMVIELHRRNIIIGDVNPLNFMVKSDTELYFVDTDSYQIEDFPCPVGTANCTAPEIQGRDFTTFLRTAEHEYFSIATLLFMILFPGKSPYSHQGGGSPGENIRKGTFPYTLDEKSNGKIPDGPWCFIWSHLPCKTKEAFHGCFSKGKRIDPTGWLELMKAYKSALDKAHSGPDAESDKIFPTRLKGVAAHAKNTYASKFSSLWLNRRFATCGISAFLRTSNRPDRTDDATTSICRFCSESGQLDTDPLYGFEVGRIQRKSGIYPFPSFIDFSTKPK